MNRFYKICLLFACSATLFSCQKVIKLDLNTADPRIVIEAAISDQPGPYSVKLTRTVNFDQSNVFPAVTGATVKLHDDAGHAETLTETSPGIYQTATITGTPSRTYTLEVTAQSKTYTAVAKMPQPVPIDSLNAQKGFFRDAKNVHVFFKDPAGVENWYRFIEIINETPITDINITEDILRDGQNIDAMIFTPEEDSLVSGDSVTVLFQSIDPGSYDYFRTLIPLTQGGDPGAAPANPKTNFSNGALGYFSVYAESRKAIIIE
jgi:hypothetical protein